MMSILTKGGIWTQTHGARLDGFKGKGGVPENSSRLITYHHSSKIPFQKLLD